MSGTFFPAYWIEVAKRAYADGDDRAMGWIDWLLTRPADQPLSYTDVPHGLFEKWNGAIADATLFAKRGCIPAGLR